ncbi:MAG: diguanylate cyclase [Chloroflexi bacterium]|jgi:diguanylate cyclase (GGDEF)-like protein|nr:diguanylate cyclase [Chloroflexota bacterium]MBT7081436.1 diguanylate cyclase [Chloroflexota bacterium]MBT7289839.1 diguanylate cyclase [Chloroflexota bacterium]
MSKEVKVLIIDGDSGFCQTLADILNEKGLQTDCAHNGAEALAKIEQGSFTVVLIDVNLPDADGIELFKNIKQMSPDIEGIIVTGYASIESAVAAVRYGTINYVMKPLVVEDVLTSIGDAVNRQQLISDEKKRLSAEIAEKERFQALATVDGLTGLYNRRYFHEFLTRELDRADRYSHDLSIFMVDIDDFKSYQDPHGHQEGDSALQYISQILGKTVRGDDIVARYGGEEFAAILPEVSKGDGVVIADRMRVAVENAKGSLKGKITISVGVASYPTDAKNKKQLIKRADDALYAAKRAGKNKTVLWDKSITKNKTD